MCDRRLAGAFALVAALEYIGSLAPRRSTKPDILIGKANGCRPAAARICAGIR